jgi:serine/threonine-protein kinase
MLDPPSATALVPGARLDRYELLWPLAEGGMASVWLARLHGRAGFEKLVAVKTILPKFAEDERFQRMFLDEARIAAGIDHTNVARVLDLGEMEGVLYIAMEWVDGDSLSKIQRILAREGVPLPEGIVLRIVADACAGLHAAHELRGRDGELLGIVHRDVSPQNILVSSEGVAKIIDFGVAKARGRVSEETSAGSLKGKIQYMSPEQALGRAVDRRADVWGVGAMLYNFFTGRKVFEAESEVATLQMLISGNPPDPLPSRVHPAVAEVIRGALHFDPVNRWASLDVMRRRIEEAMVAIGCHVRPEDVGSFVATHAPERAATRKAMVTKALLGADMRAATPEEKVSAASASGLIGVEARTGSSLVTPAFAARRVGADMSSATLGSASVEAPRRSMPPRRSASMRLIATGAIAGSVTALGLLIAARGGMTPPVVVTAPAAAALPQTGSLPAAPSAPSSPSATMTTPAPAASWLTVEPTATAPSPAGDGGAPVTSATSAGKPPPVVRPVVPWKPPPTAKRGGGKQQAIDDGF